MTQLPPNDSSHPQANHPTQVPPAYGQQPVVPAQPVYPQGYTAPNYAAPTYSGSQQYSQVPPPTNVLAIIGFIGVFFFSLIGIILGHIALNKIKSTGEGGRGLALAAVIIGYVRLAGEAAGILFMIFWLGIFGTALAGSM